MSADPPEFLYDVALSFAGEERGFVQEVAERLRIGNVRLFYDEDQIATMWGENLVESLDNVYRHQSRYAVMFISKAYAGKMWTRHERRSLQARAIKEQAAYILPVRFDNTELDGLLPTIAYVDAHRFGASGIADLILKKLGNHTTPTPRWVSGVPTTPEMMHDLVGQRPPGWEYLLYAAALLQGRDRLEPKHRDHAIGYSRPGARHCATTAEAKSAISDATSRNRHLIDQLMRILEKHVQESVFGPLGTPGDPDAIMHLAQRFADIYEGFMDASADLRGTSMPDEFHRLRHLVSHLPDSIIWRMRGFPGEFAARVHDLPQRIERDEEIHIGMEIVLEVPDGLSKAIDKEYKRLRRRLKHSL